MNSIDEFVRGVATSIQESARTIHQHRQDTVPGTDGLIIADRTAIWLRRSDSFNIQGEVALSCTRYLNVGTGHAQLGIRSN